MSDSIIKEAVTCYLCQEEVDKLDALSVPITTGGKVYTHKRCMDIYMKSTINNPSACSSCSVTSCSTSCPSS